MGERDFVFDRGWNRRLWRREFRFVESYSSIGNLGNPVPDLRSFQIVEVESSLLIGGCSLPYI